MNRDILVRVVSYRDPELLHTIGSAWERAADPARVRFAVVNQVGPETQHQLDAVRGDGRVTSVALPWRSARGLGWARRMTDRMRRDERYTLQVDSHTRFADGWDEALVAQWEALRDPRAVLSCYPGAFAPVGGDFGADAGAVAQTTVSPHAIVPAGVDQHGLPRQDVGPSVPGLARTALVSGGFQFSAGALCSELEQVRDVMVADEYVRALQLFTHGWNVHAPESVPLFHLYARDKPAGGHGFMSDFSGDPGARGVLELLLARSIETARAIISGDGAGALGTERPRADFEAALSSLPQRPHS